MVISVYNSTEEQDWLQTFNVEGHVYDITLLFPKEKNQPFATIRFSIKSCENGNPFWNNHCIVCYKNATVTIDNKVFHINDKEDMCSLYKYLTGIDYMALQKQYQIENIEQSVNKDFQ